MPATEEQTAERVERFACPTCAAPAGTACRTRSGGVAARYHTTRFILVPALGTEAEVVVPGGRRAHDASSPARSRVPVRIGYTYVPQDNTRQPAELEGVAGCARTFVDVVGPTVKARPELDQAMELARLQRQCAEGQPVVFTVHDLAALARTSTELIEICGALQAADVQLEVRSGPMAGLYDPSGTGSVFFAVLGAAGELDRLHHRRQIAVGQQAAEAAGRLGGRPRVFDEAMLSEARRLRDEGVPVPQIARALTIAEGRNAGRHPSLASVYRALSEVASEVAPSDARAAGERQ